MKEHERAVLTVDMSAHGLYAGDVGRIVHVYADVAAYEVEFLMMDGRTIDVITIDATALRRVEETDVLHVRQRA
jgi:hypothetical protein